MPTPTPSPSPLVLAIEPDLRQAAILKRIVREKVGADVTAVDSLDAAVEAMRTAVPDVLLISAPISKTGWAAPYDSPVLDGFAVAMDEINAKGGIDGRFKVELLIRDNRSDNAQNAIVTQSPSKPSAITRARRGGRLHRRSTRCSSRPGP